MRLLAVALSKDVQPRSLLQFESIWFMRATWTDQLLPIRRTRDVLDVRLVTVGQTEVFHQVLHMAAWTLNVETSLQHVATAPASGL